MDNAAVPNVRSRLRWLAPLGAVLSLALLAYIIIVDPAGPGNQFCEQANTQPCADMLAADTSVHYHQEATTLTSVCQNVRSDACALRTFSFGSARCDIHILAGAGEAVLEHERNHCRGWDHADDSPEAYAAPWHLNRDAWVVRGSHQQVPVR